MERIEYLESVVRALKDNISEKEGVLDRLALENAEMRETFEKLKEIIKPYAD